MTVLPIENYDFFWRTEAGHITGFKDGEFTPVKLETDNDGELSTRNITDLFTVDSILYFSASFQEPNPEFDPDSVPMEGAVVVPQYITVEKFFSQTKAGVVSEISSFPEKPEAVHFVGNDGMYKVETNDFKGQSVSDIFRNSSGSFNRNLKVSNYFYYGGAWIDVQEGLPGIRKAGLYFWDDNFSSLSKKKEKGQMWLF